MVASQRTRHATLSTTVRAAPADTAVFDLRRIDNVGAVDISGDIKPRKAQTPVIFEQPVATRRMAAEPL